MNFTENELQVMQILWNAKTDLSRKDIIEQLQEQGLFQLKGAISFVAKKFSCSTATIYRYLSEVSD